mgnify:CR=1 FL=1
MLKILTSHQWSLQHEVALANHLGNSRRGGRGLWLHLLDGDICGALGQ